MEGQKTIMINLLLTVCNDGFREKKGNAASSGFAGLVMR